MIRKDLLDTLDTIANAAAAPAGNFGLTCLTFGLYLLLMVGTGLYFYRKSKNSIEDYLLGGRGLGSWVTALSAQASDMSGWLLMGLPGAVYLGGLSQSWIAIGLFLGTWINWLVVAPRLRVYTEKVGVLTISGFMDRRFRCPGKLIRISSALLTLFFFTIYAAAGLVGAGKLFETMFGIDYRAAVLIGSAVMVFYTLLGGFLAVCWTDLFQGALMFFAIVALPIYAMTTLEPGSIGRAYELKEVSLSLFPAGAAGSSALMVLSLAAWGLGYFGQPHILVRFMGIKSVKLLPRATRIAMIWVSLSLAGAICVGLLAAPMYADLDKVYAENVFIYMIRDLFHPLLGGVFLAAILAAIMSTIDSQLLVSSSSLTEDFYVSLFRPKSGDAEQLWVSRLSVVAITVFACALAFDRTSSIFDLVTFAWGGFGATFGPAILMGLYSRRSSWLPVLAGMLAGTAVLLLWKYWELNGYMYEIVPGFLANLATVLVLNHFLPERNPETLAEFDEVAAEVRAK